jgi:hypothetical protein
MSIYKQGAMVKRDALNAINYIGRGDFDLYLKAIFTAVKVRKSMLEGGEGMPEQVVLPYQEQLPLDGPTCDLSVSNRIPMLKANEAIGETTFTYGSRVYRRSDIMHKTMEGVIGEKVVSYTVVGIGPKALKVILDSEPDKRTILNKKNIYEAWKTRSPIFVSHNLIEPYLDR